MKTLIGLTLFAAGLAAATFAAGAPDGAKATPPVDSQRQAALQRAKTAIVAQRLGLSADQQAKAKAIRAQTSAAVKALRENSALTPEQKRDQIAAAERAGREQWRAVLTPEQQTKLAQITSHPRQLDMLAQRRVRMNAIAKEIGVTPAQQTALRAIQVKSAAAVKAVRDDATLAPAQKQAKVRELMQTTRTELHGVLSPEQRSKLQQVRQRLLAPLGALASS